MGNTQSRKGKPMAVAITDVKKEIHEALDRAIELSPDPHAAALMTYGALAPEILDEIALRGWESLVRERMRRMRQHRAAMKHPPPIMRSPYCVESASGESRWQYLGDCTRADVRALVADYQKRGDSNYEVAERFSNLLQRMEETGATRVAELPEPEVESILSE